MKKIIAPFCISLLFVQEYQKIYICIVYYQKKVYMTLNIFELKLAIFSF